MPKLATPLTELQIRRAPAKAAAYSLADGNGLSLLISPAGLKTWTVGALTVSQQWGCRVASRTARLVSQRCLPLAGSKAVAQSASQFFWLIA